MRDLENSHQKLGQLVVLAGGSSAGKTTLGRALQELMPRPCMLLGIDVFWLALPQSQLNLRTVDPEYYSCRSYEEDDKRYFEIEPGPILDKAMVTRYFAIAEYLKRGFNVVADEVIWKELWIKEALKVFAPFKTYFVHVYCSDEVGALREKERGDRFEGWARGSARTVNKFLNYDYEVDTTSVEPGIAAGMIYSFIRQYPTPHAVDLMCDRFKIGPQ